MTIYTITATVKKPHGPKIKLKFTFISIDMVNKFLMRIDRMKSDPKSDVVDYNLSVDARAKRSADDAMNTVAAMNTLNFLGA